MITDLEIVNFQSHKNTNLSFHPGVNVVVGQSDTGKSSIIRAINWVMSNRPSGDSFRANFSKNMTEVAMAFGEDFVVRQKGKSINKYEVPSGELKALRTDVPQEVKDITQMQDVNLQPQHKSYFLLDETPGNVAKSFNSVSGLEEMDAALKNINSKVRDTSWKITHTTEKIDGLEIDIEKVQWVDEAQESLKWVAECSSDLSGLQEVHTFVKKLISEVEEQEEELNSLPDFSALPRIKEIQDLDADINTKLEHTNSICDLIDSLNELQKEQKRYTALNQLDLSTTASISQRIDDETTKLNALRLLISEIKDKDRIYSVTNNQVRVCKQEFDDLESRLKICPTCGQIIKEKS